VVETGCYHGEVVAARALPSFRSMATAAVALFVFFSVWLFRFNDPGGSFAGLTDDHFEIAIIPKTWEVTNLSHLKPGDEVNIEVDILGKYIEKLLQPQSPKDTK